MNNETTLPKEDGSDTITIVRYEISDLPKKDKPNKDRSAPKRMPKTIGRYIIKKKLGFGGMGDVYLGWDPYIKRSVAIKTSRLTSNKARSRFFIEAQSAGRLSHPNIITVYDIREYGKLSYIAMEFVEGSTLKAYCNKNNLLPVDKTIRVMIQLCEGLSYAHHQKVIHRDIKPANIILSQSGTPKIMDFGIAQITQKIKKKSIAGTPSYMSPEQIQGGKVQNITDIFSLGCVLYELLCGQKAFRGKGFAEIKRQIQTQSPTPLSQINPQLPRLLDQIINKSLAKNTYERYQTCLEFAHELSAVLRSLPGEDEVETNDDIIKHLYQMTFFKGFTEDQLNLILAASKITRAQPGKVIFAEGDIDDTLYIILSGKVSVIDQNDDFVIYLGTGEIFGEMAFLNDQARTTSVMAEVSSIFLETSVIVIDSLPDAIKFLFYKNFNIALIRRYAVLENLSNQTEA